MSPEGPLLGPPDASEPQAHSVGTRPRGRGGVLFSTADVSTRPDASASFQDPSRV